MASGGFANKTWMFSDFKTLTPQVQVPDNHTTPPVLANITITLNLHDFYWVLGTLRVT